MQSSPLTQLLTDFPQSLTYLSVDGKSKPVISPDAVLPAALKRFKYRGDASSLFPRLPDSLTCLELIVSAVAINSLASLQLLPKRLAHLIIEQPNDDDMGFDPDVAWPDASIFRNDGCRLSMLPPSLVTLSQRGISIFASRLAPDNAILISLLCARLPRLVACSSYSCSLILTKHEM